MTDGLVQNSQTKSVAKTSTLSAGLLIAGKAFNLITIFALSAIMALSAFGEFMYVRGVILFLAPFLSIGLSVTAMRRIPGYIETGKAAFAHGYLRLIVTVTLLVALIVAMATAIGGYAFAGGDRPLTLALALIGLPGSALLMAQTQAARAFGHVLISYGPLNVLQPVALAIGAAAIWLISGPPDQNQMALMLALTMLAAAALQWFLLKRDKKINATTAEKKSRQWLGESAPFTISMAAQGIVASGPLLILGFFAQSEVLGIFGFYQALMQGLTIFNTAIFGAANPKLSAHIAGSRIEEAQKLLFRSRGAACLITLVGAVVGTALIVFVSQYFKPEFGSAPFVLLALLVSIAVNSTSGPLGHVLIIHDRRFWEVATQVTAALVTLFVCFAAIPTWGMAGAAFATLAAALVRSALLHFLVFGRLRFGSKSVDVPDA